MSEVGRGTSFSIYLPLAVELIQHTADDGPRSEDPA
jgi:hypothetical protein